MSASSTGSNAVTGQWRIAHMDCIYGRDSLTAAVPGTNLAVPVHELTGLRPAYRMLAWSFIRRGIPVRDDLLGDDRPYAVTASSPPRSPGHYWTTPPHIPMHRSSTAFASRAASSATSALMQPPPG